MKSKFRLRYRVIFLFIATVLFCNTALFAENENESIGVIADQFASPDAQYRPWVYWFWNNGNLTKEGITADLEAMQRVGIKGVLIMEVGQGSPQGPVDFMSDNWRDHFKFMIAEAQRCDIEVNMNNDPGWNGSGGAWIKPDEAMQVLTWTEINTTNENGPIVLKQPPTKHDYYHDIVVLAFPTPKDLSTKEPLSPDNHRRNTPMNKVTQDACIAKTAMIDLSDKLGTDGKLDWTPPNGDWTIIRFGHTCKGIMVAPAPQAGIGLECDKLSTKGADAAFNGQIAKLVADNKDFVGNIFVSTHIDSWENGSQNWTEKMRTEFKNRREYELLRFLPVFAGYVVENADITDRFLWDFRRTVSEMVMDNHVKRMKELANKNGIRLSIEAYGSPNDHIQYGGLADEPMGEFWIGGMAMETCRGMASAGHVYGRRIIGAEVFTANDSERWLEYPGSIKTLGDRALCEGINRFVFHRYSFQPWKDVKPGLMMGPWGIHYERTQTWWEQTTAWHEYLTRCQFMLRQGQFVADICYVEPEDSPQGFGDHPRLGYPWDQCGTDAVLQMECKDGKLVLPSGMSYKVLVLPQSDRMTPQLLEKTLELVRAGATVIGKRPTKAFGYSDYPNNDGKTKTLAGRLWPDEQQLSEPRVSQRSSSRRISSSRIISDKTPEEVLRLKGIVPDFVSDKRLHTIHRQTEFGDIYFVANPNDFAQLARVAFRAEGIPEIWFPESGKMVPATSWRTVNGVTSMLLPLAATESVFVVFRRDINAHGDAITSIVKDGKTLADLSEPLSRITINRAVYGVPGDEALQIDVTKEVAQKVSEGMTNIQVEQITKAVGDPKFKTPKTLTVDYSVGNRNFTVFAGDFGTVFLGNCIPNIKIISAKYGPQGDEARTLDVKDLLQSILDSGENRFSVTQMAHRLRDPAFMVVKTLDVKYEIDGKPGTWKGNDMMFVDFEQLDQHPLEFGFGILPDGQRSLSITSTGSYMVQFASGKSMSLKISELPEPCDISDGSWKVAFPKKEATFDKLASWSESNDEYIKYFSGTATYSKKFEIPMGFLGPNRRVILDLGRVEVVAELKVNGQGLGTLWTHTKTVDVTDYLKPGKDNELEIRVTNLWPNRLIGDEFLPPNGDRNPNGTLKQWPDWLLSGKPDPSGRETFSMWNLWSKDDALLPSGLIGPVKLIPVWTVPLE